MIKKCFGKLFPRLLTGKEAQESARQEQCGVFAGVVEEEHFEMLEGGRTPGPGGE